jgi:hypothetical protein
MPRLGALAADGYSYEPSATQLEAMYRIDPASLKQVCGNLALLTPTFPAKQFFMSLIEESLSLTIRKHDYWPRFLVFACVLYSAGHEFHNQSVRCWPGSLVEAC